MIETDAEFETKNERRLALIDKEFLREEQLSIEERKELDALQAEVETFLAVRHPIPRLSDDPVFAAFLKGLNRVP